MTKKDCQPKKYANGKKIIFQECNLACNMEHEVVVFCSFWEKNRTEEKRQYEL